MAGQARGAGAEDLGGPSDSENAKPLAAALLSERPECALRIVEILERNGRKGPAVACAIAACVAALRSDALEVALSWRDSSTGVDESLVDSRLLRRGGAPIPILSAIPVMRRGEKAPRSPPELCYELLLQSGALLAERELARVAEWADQKFVDIARAEHAKREAMALEAEVGAARATPAAPRAKSL